MEQTQRSLAQHGITTAGIEAIWSALPTRAAVFGMVRVFFDCGPVLGRLGGQLRPRGRSAERVRDAHVEPVCWSRQLHEDFALRRRLGRNECRAIRPPVDHRRHRVRIRPAGCRLSCARLPRRQQLVSRASRPHHVCSVGSISVHCCGERFRLSCESIRARVLHQPGRSCVLLRRPKSRVPERYVAWLRGWQLDEYGMG